MTDELEQRTIEYIARQTAQIRAWFFDTVLDAALGWDDCRSLAAPLDGYPSPVRVQAVAEVLRARIDAAGDEGLDVLDYIRSTRDLDLVDELRHCHDELAPLLQVANEDYRRSRAARAGHYAEIAQAGLHG